MDIFDVHKSLGNVKGFQVAKHVGSTPEMNILICRSSTILSQVSETSKLRWMSLVRLALSFEACSTTLYGETDNNNHANDGKADRCTQGCKVGMKIEMNNYRRSSRPLSKEHAS